MKTLFNWIGRALSQGGTPSSKRLFAFMFVVTVCIAALYKVFHAMDLPTYILYPLLGMIALLSGVATIAQLMSIARGTPAPKEEPKQNTNA